ncbi:helix-turn-helix domain-containing protein [Sphingomonas abietis]|uniref:Helix-turn-helix domain-containing protein n=1 Tax=Sphingomonas abietis TaxID=3012344 RepID=A0ABY7NKP2_9SPHN|nr:helix-turn-helix domain-containing protein [Sphingomonas abietis]WBO21812.1 helix-turn-helix domain-containing protein [Sphingomonas abietis]
MQVTRSAQNSTSGYRMPAHRHDDYMVMIPDRGLIEVRDERAGWATALVGRQFLIVPPGTLHSSISVTETQSHVAIYLHSDTVAAVARNGKQRAQLLEEAPMGAWTASATLGHLMAARHEMTIGAETSLDVERVRRLDALLAFECLAISASRPRLRRSTTQAHGAALVREIHAFLDGNLDRPLDLDVLADHFRISRRHLTRLFVEISGETILSRLQTLRIGRAKEYLAHTRMSVIEIALAVGFQSPSHFGQMFRRQTGAGPAEWRRQQSGPVQQISR